MIRFLVDAQVPLRLTRTLVRSGFGTLHTKDLPRGNATPEADISRILLLEERVVITKDADFAQTLTERYVQVWRAFSAQRARLGRLLD